MKQKSAVIDRQTVTIGDERNLLELIRKSGIELPTFCYHTEISIYGACRMCMVEVEGRGVLPACSIVPEDGMIVHTGTKQIRDMRKMIIELTLASHDHSCTTCQKSGDCRLQSIARQLGVKKVRFKQIHRVEPVDLTNPAIARDTGKCILCGDCVRTCSEIQSVGALDFAYRGADARVVTCFNKDMGDVECVSCGQCIKVCPVGALTINSQISKVWDAIYDSKKIAVVQIAPAVRVAIGEEFGFKPGTITIGQVVSALKRMGFEKVFDTCFGADFTVVEEGREFLKRKKAGEKLPLFTSCCPAWVKFAEQYYPDLLENLSTCRSPQAMFASLWKDKLTREMKIPREDLVLVSVMPCTAKKFEAKREELGVNGNPDVDIVITTEELATMIRESGIDFENLEPGAFDMPYGFKTGAGVIFGSSGGVAEAVLRFAADTLCKGSSRDFTEIRYNNGLTTAEVDIGGDTLRLAVVSGLANARALIDKVRKKEEHFDIIEVMACRGGCVNGGGQPVTNLSSAVTERAKGLYNDDRMLHLHISSENPYLQQIYNDDLTEERAHELLHTTFCNRRRILEDDFVLSNAAGEKALSISVCFGTSCFLRGSQELYTQLTNYIRENGLDDKTEFKANFCGEHCKKGPYVVINGKGIEHCTLGLAVEEIQEAVTAAAR